MDILKINMILQIRAVVNSGEFRWSKTHFWVTQNKEDRIGVYLWDSSIAFITDRKICSFPPFSEIAYSFPF